jgi:hypothetical protein
VRYRVLASFRRDFYRLKPEHQDAFRAVVSGKFAPACDAWAAAVDSGRVFAWPRSLRVDALVGGRGILEMTWSFASPDGRATFQLDREGGEWFCTWRRIGDHSVFRDP